MKVYIGTSGYYYPNWIKKFYPEDLKSSDYITYYQKFFNTVEINSTFYHMPKPSTMKTLKSKVSKDFKISVKAPKIITHIKKLKNCNEELLKFFDSISNLKENLGVVLFQLLPQLKFDKDLLLDFISNLKPDIKYAFEFRHKTWLNSDTYEILKKFNISFVITHGDNYPFEKVETADFVYIRLHGPKELYASSYSLEELREWSIYIKELESASKTVFVYFNNDFYGYAIDNATTLKNLLA